jgi:hypothetical protein
VHIDFKQKHPKLERVLGDDAGGVYSSTACASSGRAHAATSGDGSYMGYIKLVAEFGTKAPSSGSSDKASLTCMCICGLKFKPKKTAKVDCL